MVISVSFNKHLNAEELESSDIENLRAIDINDEQLNAFNRALIEKYGQDALQDMNFNTYIKVMLQYKSNNDAHILNLAHLNPSDFLIPPKQPTPPSSPISGSGLGT